MAIGLIRYFLGQEMHVQKISKAIASAIAYLEEAIDSKHELNEKEVVRLTWKAASELEYALFLFSLVNPEETRNSLLTLPPTKQSDIESLQASSQSLLKGAAESLKADDTKEVHRKTWLARGQLLRIHDFFLKKQRKALKFSR